MSKVDILHIYGQEAWHEPVLIYGTASSLKKLRDTIDITLSGGLNASEFFVNDGEGYTVQIKIVDEELEELAVPYSDPIAKENRTIVKWPLCI